ncbi:MAG: hypothetical protein VW912_04960, partial [Flavobacteriaceae bacterium]
NPTTTRRKITTETETISNYTDFHWRQPTYIFTFTYRINENKNSRKRSQRSNGDGGDDGEFDF